MKTKKQEELIRSFLEILDDKNRPIFEDIISYLSELGYSPKKEKSSISFKHDAHNKQIVKMKMLKNSPYFALRFSACKEYSRRFAEVIAAFMTKYPTRDAGCPSGRCSFCSGEPETHVYSHNISGSNRLFCGSYALEVPNLTADDAAEIKLLLQQEHVYLMKHEAKAAI